MKKTLTILFAFVLLAQLAKPLGVLAQETTDNANISVNSTVSVENELIQAKELPPETVQDILKDVCQARGYGDTCAKNLLGMLWKESNNVATAVGDHGLALGYFQIHYRMHHVTAACATDLRCSANWTLDYLEQHSYPKYPTYAIQCHNGCNIDNGYAAAAIYHGNRLWNQPLQVNPAVTVTASTQLAKN